MNKNQMLILLLLAILAIKGYSQASSTTTTCVEGQYYNATAAECQNCQPGCNNCENKTTCFKCGPGFFFNETILTLPAPKPGDLPPIFCPPCKVGNCSLCSFTSLNACQACRPGFFYNQTAAACRPCLLGCESCTGPLACLKCAANQTYVPSADSTKPGQCQGCPQNCQTCSNSTYCSKCFPKFFVNPNFMCNSCPPGCLDCVNGTSCNQCAPNTFFSTGGVAIACIDCDVNCGMCGAAGCDACKFGFFKSGTGCAKCMDQCLSCDTQTSCQQCNITKFFDLTTKMCRGCPSNCANCTSATACANCLPGFNLVQGQCSQCPDNCAVCNGTQCALCNKGFFNFFNSSTNTSSCQRCTHDCENCVQIPGLKFPQCNQCRYGFQIDYTQQPQMPMNNNTNQTNSTNTTSGGKRLLQASSTENNTMNITTNHKSSNYDSMELCPKPASDITVTNCVGNCNREEDSSLQDHCKMDNMTNNTICGKMMQVNSTTRCQNNYTLSQSSLTAAIKNPDFYNNFAEENITDFDYNQQIETHCRINIVQNCSRNCSLVQTQDVTGPYACKEGCVTHNRTVCFIGKAGSQDPSSFGEHQCVLQYGFYLNDTDKSVAMCSVAIPGCQSCGYGFPYYSPDFLQNDTSVEFMCYSCNYDSFYNRQLKKCSQCQNSMPNCQSCQNATYCYWCTDGFVVDPNSGQCKSCSIKGCKYCHFDQGGEVCDNCNDGLGFNKTSKTCVPCSNFFPGCGYCGLYYDYSSMNNTNNTNGTNGTDIQIIPIMKCYNCLDQSQFFNEQKKACVPCSEKIPGCKGCYSDYYTQQLSCYWCGDGYTYDEMTNTCQNCMTLVSNCQECHKEYVYNYNYNYTDNFTNTTNNTNTTGGTKRFLQTGDTNTTNSTTFPNGTLPNGTFPNGTLPNGTLPNNTLPNNSYPTYQVKLMCHQCVTGYSLSIATQLCEKVACIDNCITCYNVPNWTRPVCGGCVQGYFYDYAKGLCIKETACPVGTFYNGTACMKCAERRPNCYDCVSQQVFKPGFEISEFLTWNLTFQQERIRGAYIYNISCLSCNNDFNLTNNTCVQTIGMKNCPFGCSDCDLAVGSVKCKACNDMFDLDTTVGMCKLNCEKKGLFGCQACDFTDFNKTKFQCFQCQPGYIFNPEVQQCKPIPTCALGSVFDIKAGNCSACPEFCDGCNIRYDFNNLTQEIVGKSVQCQVCTNKYKLDAAGKCVYQGETYVQACPYGCDKCAFNTKLLLMECSQCKPSFSPEINITTNVMECKLYCPPNCNHCFVNSTNGTVCDECIEGFSLDKGGSCVVMKTCTAAQYFDPNKNLCSSCPANCVKCFWDDNVKYARCIYCAQNYKLTIDLTCRQKLAVTEANCPLTAYEDTVNQQCQKCPEKCQVCAFNSDLNAAMCSQCAFGYVVDNTGNCALEVDKTSTTTASGNTTTSNTITCPEGYFMTQTAIAALQTAAGANLTAATACAACPTGCAQCKWNQDLKIPYCFKCSNDNDFQLNDKGVCLSKQCPAATIFNPSSGCEKCPDKCKTCERTSTGGLSCIECASGFKPTDGVCTFDASSCPAKTMSVGSYCKACPEPCSACAFNTATNVTTCSSCVTGFNPVQNQCVKTCSAGKFFGPGGNLGILDCYDCPLGCTACNFVESTKTIACTLCNTELKFTFNETQKKCIPPVANTTNGSSTVSLCEANKALVYDLDGSYYCKDCPTGCATCFYDKVAQGIKCKTCSSNFIYNVNTQLCAPNVTAVTLTCNDGQRIDYVNKACIACPTGCSKCVTSTNKRGFACTSCSNSYQFRDDYCFLTCESNQMPAFQSDGVTQACKTCSTPCVSCKMNYLSSPPQEVCFACESGFYVQNQACQIIPTCPSGQFSALQADGYANFKSFCTKCPYGCSSCSAPDLTKPFTDLKCSECQASFILNDNNLCIANFELSKPTCTSTQIAFLKTDKTWQCLDCPTGCTGCDKRADGQFSCFGCSTGYFVKKFDNYKTCVAVKVCTANQYSVMDNDVQSCVACPSTCETCQRNDILNADSLICLTCKSGYQKNAKERCEQVFTSGSQIPAGTCATGEYPAVYSGFIKCQKCPAICTKCGFDDPTSPSATTFKCSECIAGFAVADGKCRPNCKEGQYYDGTECKACAFPCTNCLGALAAQCQVCADGYTLKTGTGCEKKVEKVEKNCGKTAVYVKTDDSCKCLDSTQIFNPAETKCFSLKAWLEKNDCGSSQYKDISNNECKPCRSTDSNNLCSACTGGQSADCLGCPSGYFLNKDTFSCDSCPSGCEACPNGNSCSRCKAGTFEFITKDTTSTTGQKMQCLSACPSGTLPSVLKFYIQNKELFSETELSEKLDVSNKPTTEATSSTPAIAIGVFQEPVYNAVPWTINNQGEPTYLDQLVRLSCSSCKAGCSVCYGDEMLSPTLKKCFKDKCPTGQVRKEVDGKFQCTVIVASDYAVQSCTQRTVSPDSQVQSASKKYFVQCATTGGSIAQRLLQSNNEAFSWSITEIKKDNVGLQKEGYAVTNMNDDFEEGDKDQIKMSLFSNVKLDKNTLDIPSANLKKNTFYKIQFTATLAGKTASQSFGFFVRDEEKKKSLEDLITPDLITVTPDTGISGETTFTAQYTLDNGNDNLRFFKDAQEDSTAKKWKISIKVGANGPTFSSFNLNDQIKFQVPPNTKSDQDIDINFVISNGEQTFTAKRKITAQKNTNFDITKSAATEKLTSGTTSASDLAAAASAVAAQLSDSAGSCANLQVKLDNQDGPCTTSEASACCGHGTCAAGKTSKYICQCSSGWAGKACEVPQAVYDKIKNVNNQVLAAAANTPVTADNADALLSSLQSAAQSTTMDATASGKALDKLKEIGNLCTDPTMLTNVLGSISTTTKATAVTGNTEADATAAKETQKAALDAMKAAVSKFSSTLDSANPEATIEAPGVTGKSKFVDASELGTNDKVTTQIQSSSSASGRLLQGSTVETEINLKQAVFSGKTKATVSALQLNSDALSNVDGGKTVISKNLEVSLINPTDGSKYNVNSVTGTCPIQFVLEAKVSASGKLPKCKYFDTTLNKFTDTGCTTTSSSLGGNNLKVTCCCNHLTTFAVTEEDPASPNPNTNTGGTSQTYVPIGASLTLWSLALFAILLAFLI